MTFTIAQADVTAAVTVFQILFSAIVSTTLWRMTAWQRRYEGLENRLQDATARLIDERIRGVTTQLELHARSTTAAQEEFRQRLAGADRAVAAMADRDVRIELALASKLDLVKDYIREFAICKSDLERYEAAVDRRLTRIEARLEELAT